MDLHSFWLAGSGSRRKQIPHKKVKISSFEVLDVFFLGMKTYPVAWMSFMEA